MTHGWTIVLIVGLAGVTLLSRCFFFILDQPWPLPGWAERALHYAPVAALAGVVLPEILTVNGHLIGTWQDARLFAAALAVAVYAWRRNVLLTMVTGLAVYLPLHLVAGW